MDDPVQASIRDIAAMTATVTDDLPDQTLQAVARKLDELSGTTSEADAQALLRLLPPDGDIAHGLNWTIVHAIEACETWPFDGWSAPWVGSAHEWVELLQLRLRNERANR